MGRTRGLAGLEALNKQQRWAALAARLFLRAFPNQDFCKGRHSAPAARPLAACNDGTRWGETKVSTSDKECPRSQEREHSAPAAHHLPIARCNESHLFSSPTIPCCVHVLIRWLSSSQPTAFTCNVRTRWR